MSLLWMTCLTWTNRFWCTWRKMMVLFDFGYKTDWSKRFLCKHYRRRLIDAEMIVEAGRARVDFALPYLRDFLREHATALVVDSDAT